MKALFAGSPAIAVPAFLSLCDEAKKPDSFIQIAGVLTNCDTPKGRKNILSPTEIGMAAQNILLQNGNNTCLSFPILKPQKLDGSFLDKIKELAPDLLVSFAYGKIFSPKFLSLFLLGGINVHPSLLPKYRGASPIQNTILNRDKITGITFQTLAQEMDSGDIIVQEEVLLTGRETCLELNDTMAQKAAAMIVPVLKTIADGTIIGKPQNHSKAVYCSRISREDAVIDWNDSALDIDAKIRAFNVWPVCHTIHKGRELYILKASVYNTDAAVSSEESVPSTVLKIDKKEGILVQTGDGILAIKELQYQTKKALQWQDFCNGVRDFAGSKLGC